LPAQKAQVPTGDLCDASNVEENRPDWREMPQKAGFDSKRQTKKRFHLVGN